MHDAQFLTSAPTVGQLPPAPPSGVELTFVGRSNVGKSSLINTMLGRKGLAKTSNTPGKTRLMNVYEVTWSEKKELSKTALKKMAKQAEEASSELLTLELDPQTPPEKHLWHWVDLPGYGYARVSKTEQAQWQRHFERFLRGRTTLKAVLQLVDARHGLKDIDRQMWDYLLHHGHTPLLVLTKWDKLSAKERGQAVSSLSKELLIDPQYIVPFSATSGFGKAPLWQALLNEVAGI